MKKTFIILILSIVSQFCEAQFFRFSQFTNLQMLANPALTASSDWSGRAGIAYHNQWNSTYTTYFAFADYRIIIPKISKADYFGAGVMVLSDNAGDGNMATVGAYGSLVYNKSLIDNTLTVSWGLGYGVFNKKVDYSKLTFNNQWNGSSFDPAMQSNEPVANPTGVNSLRYSDLNSGFMVNVFSSNTRWYAGASIFNLYRSTVTFYNDFSPENQLAPKYNINAGFVTLISERSKLGIHPEAMYTIYKQKHDLLLGLNLFYFGKFGPISRLNFGVTNSHRNNTLIAGLQYNNLNLQFSWGTQPIASVLSSSEVSTLEFALKYYFGTKFKMDIRPKRMKFKASFPFIQQGTCPEFGLDFYNYYKAP